LSRSKLRRNDALPDLLAGQGPLRVEEGGDEIDETLQAVHATNPAPTYSEAMSFSTRSSRALKGSLQRTVRCA
jgi:hypothetical protein